MIVDPLSSGAVHATSTLPLCYGFAVTAHGTPGTKPVATASALRCRFRSGS